MKNVYKSKKFYKKKKTIQLFLTNFFKNKIKLKKKKKKLFKYTLSTPYLKKYKNIIRYKLDFFLFFLKQSKSILHSKQLINHKFITINLKTITISNFFIKKFDIIQYSIKKKIIENKIKNRYKHIYRFIILNKKLKAFVLINNPYKGLKKNI